MGIENCQGYGFSGKRFDGVEIRGVVKAVKDLSSADADAFRSIAEPDSMLRMIASPTLLAEHGRASKDDRLVALTDESGQWLLILMSDIEGWSASLLNGQPFLLRA